MLTLFFVDAGPSELMAALLQKLPQLSFELLTKKDAPALTIFKKYALVHKTTLIKESETNLQKYIQESSILITGTSWQTTLHFKLYEAAHKKSTPIYALLDHWVNYDRRFIEGSKNYAPLLSGFLVQDIYAEKEAQKHNLTPTIAIKNQHLHNLQKNFTHNIESNTLLFLSEPTHNVALRTYKDSHYWGFNEYTALHDICKNFQLFECTILTIRLHPSDTEGKYDNIIALYPNLQISVQRSDDMELNDALKSAKCVIGFDTYALYVAHILGINAISYLPSENRHCSLALPSTQIIKDLADVESIIYENSSEDIQEFGEDFSTFIKGIK